MTTSKIATFAFARALDFTGQHAAGQELTVYLESLLRAVCRAFGFSKRETWLKILVDRMIGRAFWNTRVAKEVRKVTEGRPPARNPKADGFDWKTHPG